MINPVEARNEGYVKSSAYREALEKIQALEMQVAELKDLNSARAIEISRMKIKLSKLERNGR